MVATATAFSAWLANAQISEYRLTSEQCGVSRAVPDGRLLMPGACAPRQAHATDRTGSSRAGNSPHRDRVPSGLPVTSAARQLG